MAKDLTTAQNARKAFGLPHIGPAPGIVFSQISFDQNGTGGRLPQYDEYFVLDGKEPHDGKTLYAVCIAHAAELIAARPTLKATLAHLGALGADGKEFRGGSMMLLHGTNLNFAISDTVTPAINEIASNLRGHSNIAEALAASAARAIDYSGITRSVALRFRDARYGRSNFGFGN